MEGTPAAASGTGEVLCLHIRDATEPFRDTGTNDLLPYPYGDTALLLSGLYDAGTRGMVSGIDGGLPEMGGFYMGLAGDQTEFHQGTVVSLPLQRRTEGACRQCIQDNLSQEEIIHGGSDRSRKDNINNLSGCTGDGAGNGRKTLLSDRQDNHADSRRRYTGNSQGEGAALQERDSDREGEDLLYGGGGVQSGILSLRKGTL